VPCATRPGPTAHRLARARAGLVLALLLAAGAASLTALLALGARPPFDLPVDPRAWGDVPPADALAAVLRWLAIAATAWLVAAIVASGVWAVATGRRTRTPRRRSRLVPLALRRLAEQALLGGVALGVAAAPALAQTASRSGAPVVTVVRDGRASDLASLPGVATPAPPPAESSESAAPAPAPGDRLVVVAPGEHLWELAAREVARVQGVPRDAVRDADVAPYWRAVCDVNRGRLQSGDVGLVYAGETVVLPAPG
jgi:hypothetical protein